MSNLNFSGDIIVDTTIDLSCPMCNKKTIRLNTEPLNIPYFDDVINSTIYCKNCNYKHSDLLITSQKEPLEYSFEISSIDDMCVRVIRSSTATIELPDLGIKIEPGAASDAFVSNIEGILVRVSDVIQQALNFTDNMKKKAKAEKLLKIIKDLRAGKITATVIIKDPMGNSAIVSKKSKTRKLSLKETKELKTGMIIFELNDKQIVE